MIKQHLLITALIFFHHSRALTPNKIDLVIFWNIGQGQWVTHVTGNLCLHFDAGGSSKAFKKHKSALQKFCSQNENRFLLSHPDLDHYSLISSIQKSVRSSCWYDPLHPTIKTSTDMPTCLSTQNIKIDAYYPVTSDNHLSKNESSIIYRHKSFLFPGDSTIKMESIWTQTMSLKSVKYLLLGHHGSQTSTSDHLLKQLPNLQMAIVQSQFSKYGHPHKKVTIRLKIKKIPLLRTEEWGNIGIEI